MQQLLQASTVVQRAEPDAIDVHTCSLAKLTEEVLDGKREPRARALDLRVLVYRDEALSTLTPGEKYELIQLVLDDVASKGMTKSILEALWGSFGDELPRRAALNFDLFDRSHKKGAALDELPCFQELRQKFRSDVAGIVRGFLDENEAIANAEREKFGYDNARPGTDWRGQTQKLHADATRVKQTTEAMERLRHTVVGYDKLVDVDTSIVENERVAEGIDRLEPKLPVRFDPKGQPPPFTLRGDEGFGTDTWADLNVRYTELEKSLLEFATANPTVYALMQQDRLDEVTELNPKDMREQDWLRSKAGDALDETLLSIHLTRTRLDEDDIQFDAFEPIHEQLVAGKVGGAFWQQPLPKWVANDVLADARSDKAWNKLMVSLGSGVAFAIATMSGIGLVGFALAAGAGAAGTTYQLSTGFNDWRGKVDAASSDMSSKLEIVRPEQANDAKWDLILDAAFAALDVYGAGKDLTRLLGLYLPARAGARAAAQTADALKSIGACQPKDAKLLLERAIAELGVEATRKHSGLGIDDLLRKLGADTPEASAAVAVLKRQQTVDALKGLKGLDPAHARATIERAIREIGVEATAVHAGGFENLIGMVRTASRGESAALDPQVAMAIVTTAVEHLGPARMLLDSGLSLGELTTVFIKARATLSHPALIALSTRALDEAHAAATLKNLAKEPRPYAAHRIEQSVEEIGVEATIRHSGMTGEALAELVAKVRPSSPVLPALRAPVAAAALPLMAAAALSEAVLDVYDKAGPVAAIRQFGGWSELARNLGENTAAGNRLLHWRDNVLAEQFREYVASIGGQTMRTGNVGKVSNDFDWIFLGPNASATRDDALRWLAARVDASSVDEARRMLHGAGFSDPRRLHRYDSLPPDLRMEALEHQTKVEQEQTFARLIAKAKETPDNPGYYTKLRDDLGIAPAAVGTALGRAPGHAREGHREAGRPARRTRRRGEGRQDQRNRPEAGDAQRIESRGLRHGRLGAALGERAQGVRGPGLPARREPARDDRRDVVGRRPRRASVPAGRRRFHPCRH